MMKGFDTNSALLAHHSAWDPKTLTVTLDMEVENDNYHEMMMQDGYMLDNCSIRSSKNGVEIIVEEDARKQVLNVEHSTER